MPTSRLHLPQTRSRLFPLTEKDKKRMVTIDPDRYVAWHNEILRLGSKKLNVHPTSIMPALEPWPIFGASDRIVEGGVEVIALAWRAQVTVLAGPSWVPQQYVSEIEDTPDLALRACMNSFTAKLDDEGKEKVTVKVRVKKAQRAPEKASSAS